MFAALLVAVLLGGLGIIASAPASAQSASDWAYVWNDDFSADAYTPNEAYQYNSTGGVNTIARSDVGVYVVSIPGLVKEAQTQVTTLSENGELCRIAGAKGVGKAVEYTVNCIAIGGDPIDIGFFLLTFRGSAGPASAYLWANDPAAESYTPDERYQFNSSGGVNTIVRTDVGTYTIDLPGQGAESGGFQLSAANSAPGASCAVRRWAIGEDNLKQVEVNCFDATGAHVDSAFTLLYVDGNDANAPQTTGAYLLVNHASAEGSFTPGKVYQFSSAGVDNTVVRTEIGTYTVTLPEVGAEAGNLQVTAYEYPVAACSIPRWVLDGTTYQVDVVCYDAEGNPADSIFMLMYVIADNG
jgi:hypothetical protein